MQTEEITNQAAEVVPHGMNKVKRDLTGEKIGDWQILREAPRSGRGYRTWWCRCVCGLEKAVRQDSLLRHGGTRSCGCVSAAKFSKLYTKHGLSKTKNGIYKIWCGIKCRCTCAGFRAYKWYGAKGIRVCRRYADSFEAFRDDMGERVGRMTVDRIDTSGHYSCGKCGECIANGWPVNVRWATYEEQANNRPDNIVLELDGEKMTLAQWGKRLGVDGQTIRARLRWGWPLRDALTIPPQRRGYKMRGGKRGLAHRNNVGGALGSGADGAGDGARLLGG